MVEHTHVISNVAVLDGTGAAVLPEHAVIVEGRRISWIGPADALPAGYLLPLRD
ncbi:MAG TPA: hypothetical protein VF482_12995 [Trebonia sp.]